MVEKSPGKKLEPVHETKETVAFLGVELPKAKNRENAPKLEQFQDYVYDAFSLELLKKIAISLRQGDPVLIEGGTSIGKTTAVRLLCARGGYEVHYVNLNGATDIEDLMGRYIPNHERRSSTDPEYVFADGKVTSGLRQEEGKIKVIVLDEFGAAAPNISIRLHEVIDALERGGEVVLSEDASERLVVDKGKTKVVALTNPPGRGYLQREPLDPAQLRRWVYLKEPNELPDDTLTHSTRALFSLEPKTQAVQESAYLLPNERALTPEQLKEIPGIDVILEKYLEFHRGAKQLLAGRHIAADQPQRFSFDDREEPKRVRDFIAAFYRGDINETVQTALRYYYAGKLLSDEDKDKLEELIRTVEYVPVAGESKRKALKSNDGNPDQSVTFDAEAETVPGAATLEEAERILGKDVLGPKDIEQIFGAKIERVPSIPFSRAELETARELGQILVLRTDKIAKGKPMSIEAMHDQLSEGRIIEYG
jgi:MoxR-like ATPase